MKHTKSSRRTLRALVGQIFLATSVAQARNDAPPTSDKAWLPPKLSDYENQLAGQRFHEVETGSRVSINPRKTYNLAELIDIAERNNRETRVAWERARQAAAAVVSITGGGSRSYNSSAGRLDDGGRVLACHAVLNR